MWVRLRFWLTAFVRRTRFERELADELAFHVRARAEEWERRGLSPGEARRRARVELGNVGRIKDDIREVRLGRWLAPIVQDLRYGWRTLRRYPGITTVGVASLAVGIGTSAFFFSQFNAMVLRPLPGVRDPAALVAIDESLSYPAFERVRELEETVDAAAAYIGPVPFTVGVDDTAGDGERAFGHHVSPDYFATLGVVPTVGRLFGPETERVGSEPVVVVSHQFWTRRLNADSGAVGQALRVNGRTATLVGVAAEGFRGVFPMRPADIFVPVTAGASFAPELGGDILANPAMNWFQVVARLARAVSMPAAEAALDTVTRPADLSRLDIEKRRREGRHVSLLPAGRAGRFTPEQLRRTAALYGLLMGLVLSLACANLAGLLLARASERRKEMAVRLALGAGRARLLRQLLTESVLLGLGGGVAGLLFSLWLSGVFNAMNSAAGASISFEPGLRVDPRVTLFTAGLAVAIGVAVGLAPALAATRRARTGVSAALRDGARAPLSAHRRFGVRNVSIGGQVAVAVMLVLVVGCLVVGYQRYSGIDPGFETADLSLFAIYPGRDGFAPAQLTAMLEELPERLGTLPEVRTVTLADRVPLGAVHEWGASAAVGVSPTAEGDADQLASRMVARDYVGVNYFATLGIPVARGRAFAARDFGRESAGPRHRTATPIIVNETGARRLFGDDVAIGQPLRTDDQQSYVVVGVVPDVRAAFVTDVVPTVFVPIRSESLGWSWTEGTTVMVRAVPCRDAMPAVRRELARTYPGLTIFDVRTMDEHIGRFEHAIRYNVRHFGVLGLFGLALGAIGLAGVTSYAVTRRRREIGIRLALGARSTQVLWLVLHEATALTLVGALAGSAGGVALTRALSALDSWFATILQRWGRSDLPGGRSAPVRSHSSCGLLRARLPGRADRPGRDVAVRVGRAGKVTARRAR